MSAPVSILSHRTKFKHKHFTNAYTCMQYAFSSISFDSEKQRLEISQRCISMRFIRINWNIIKRLTKERRKTTKSFSSNVFIWHESFGFFLLLFSSFFKLFFFVFFQENKHLSHIFRNFVWIKGWFTSLYCSIIPKIWR